MGRYKIYFDVYFITPSDKHIPGSFDFEIYFEEGKDIMEEAYKLLEERMNKELPNWKYEVVGYLINAY